MQAGAWRRAGDWLLGAAFAVTVVIYATVPIVALRWAAKPFIGFVVEQTLVVSDYGGEHWGSRPTGLHYPQQITSIAGQPVENPGDLSRIAAAHQPGAQLAVETRLPDGTTETHLTTTLSRFPIGDWVRMFWLPYGVGLAYGVIAAWIALRQQLSVATTVLIVFCLATSVANALFFDLITTHVGVELWTITIALEGSAMIGLALDVPRPWEGVRRHPWLRVLPYALATGLAAWGVLVLRQWSIPWAYVTAWRASFGYAAVGVLALVGAMAYRLHASRSPVEHQQVRLILLGSILAFGPVAVWLAAPGLGIHLRFDTIVFLPWLLLFPVSIALAITRYRLWDLDVIVNRTLVYGGLTAVLGAVYVAGIVGIQALLARWTGQSSSVAIAVSTLATTVLFGPLRRRMQALIDRRFYRQKYDAAQTLGTFAGQLRQEIDLAQLSERLAEAVQHAIRPTFVGVWLPTPEGFAVAPGPAPPVEDAPALTVPSGDPLVARLRTVAGPLQLGTAASPSSPALVTLGSRGIRLLVPLVCQAELVGWLGLGSRRGGQSYTPDEKSLLRGLAAQAGPAIRVAQLVAEHQQELLAREKLAYELHLAQRIQESLLPKAPPAIPGWELAVHWHPAQAVGGDFYDHLVLPDGRLAITIADVVDKGIPAALVMANTRSIMRGLARWGGPPQEVLARANQLLCPELPTGIFVTCLYALLDPREGTLSYANAGHNPPYLRGRAGMRELWATGMALGVLPDIAYEERTTPLGIGDYVLLYSDGLSEAHSPSGEMFGIDRIRAVMATAHGSAHDLVAEILEALSSFTTPAWTQEDDITLMVLRRLPMSETTA